MPKLPRPRRIPVAGARAQLALSVADVVNVSRTGALIRTTRQQHLGAEWPLVLELSNSPVQLTARVVRCEPAHSPRPGTRKQYALGLAFIDPSTEAQAEIDRFCRESRAAAAAEEARRLCVSFVRRCPQCKSRSVRKQTPHHYICNGCRYEFAGLRIGILRFAR